MGVLAQGASQRCCRWMRLLLPWHRGCPSKSWRPWAWDRHSTSGALGQSVAGQGSPGHSVLLGFGLQQTLLMVLEAGMVTSSYRGCHGVP